MTGAQKPTGRIPGFLRRREWLLAVLIVIVYFVFNSQLPESYTVVNLLNQSRVYMVDVGFMAVGMLMVLILGDIDISVASIAALASTVMAVTYNAGQGLPFLVSVGLMLLVGLVCGLINGLLVTRFHELFPMIITLATQTLYRGIAYIILKDQSAGSFPSWFSKDLGYGSVRILGVEVPLMLICILAVFPLYYLWIHRTAPGRRMFAAGTNITASRYSGVRTDRLKMIAFAFNGVMAAVAGIFLCSRTGSVKYTIAAGFEMQAIAVAILGGASTSGGRGSVVGLLLALVLMTALKNGLMLLYNDAFILNLSIGLMLILIVLVPNLWNMYRSLRTLRRQRLAISKS